MAYDPGRPPAFLQQKTPVSYLNEFCSRFGSAPTFQPVSVRDPSQSLPFACMCTIGEKSVVGYGRSKQNSKHDAALKMICLLDPGIQASPEQKQFGQVVPGSTVPNQYYAAGLVAAPRGEITYIGNAQQSSVVQPTACEGDADGNVIGRVQEYAQKKGWSLPTYDIQQAESAHGLLFVMTVKLQGMSYTATANNKKDAKKMAASGLWRQLNGSGNGSKMNQGPTCGPPPGLGMGNIGGKNNQHVQENIQSSSAQNNRAVMGRVQPLLQENNHSLDRSMNSLAGLTSSMSLGGSATTYPKQLATVPHNVQSGAGGSQTVEGPPRPLLPPVTQEYRNQLSEFYTRLSGASATASAGGNESGDRSTVHQRLQDILSNNTSTVRDYVQHLRQLEQEFDLKVTYHSLPERLHNGDYQCLLQLTHLPVAVCYGLGSTPEKAMQFAAQCALQYLYIMTG